MKNFKKVIASVLSVAAICSSSAFAATEYGYTGDINKDIAKYDADAHALTLTVDGVEGDATVLVLDNGKTDVGATGENILYINQYAANETAYATMKLKGDALADGTYVVKYGYELDGEFAIKEGTITVTTVADKPETVTVTFVLGDVDADSVAGLGDANYILAYLAGGSKTIDPSTIAINTVIAGDYVLGDVDADGVAGLGDANYILAYLAGGSKTIAPSEYAINTEVSVEVPVN